MISAIIPARYGSTRFPGKPLADINGISMIERVYTQTKKSKRLSEVIVATDHKEIFDKVVSFGGHCMMTSAQHSNGTERCAEVASKLKSDYIVNVQGDEPYIDPAQIDALCSLLVGDTEIATLIKLVENTDDIENNNVVKVVTNKWGEAMYFSRSMIPNQIKSTADSSNHNYFKHIGIYGFRKDTLTQLVQLPKSKLEIAESLEQLRWLENGYKIATTITSIDTVGIDTPEDITKVKSLME